MKSNTYTLSRIITLCFFLLWTLSISAQTIYQHNFDSSPYNHPYAVAPSILDPNLTSGPWTNTLSSWTSFTGSSGQALAISTASPATTTLTLTLSVNTGYQMTVNSFSFYHRSSSTGYSNWSMTINGINVGSGAIFVSSGTSLQSTGTLAVANPVSNLTGTVTVVLTLSGGSHGSSGTFRYDDFTLNGLVAPLCTPPTLTTNITNVSCYGTSNGAIDLIPTGGTTPLGYSWTGPGSYTASTEDISGLAPGTYTVVVTANGGCTATTSATITQPSQATITASNSGPVCQGDVLTLNASTITGATYTWTGPLSFSNTGQSQSITNIQPVNGGTYTVIATVNGCASAPATTQVIVKPKPSISFYASADPTTCNGTNGSITISGLAPTLSYTVNYSFNSIPQPPVTLTASVAGRITIPNLSAGIYTNITAALNGCISNALVSIQLSDPAAPVISGTAFINPSTCNGTNGSISLNGLTPSTTYTIHYQKNSIAQTPVTATSNGTGMLTLNNLSAGIYSNITVTAANGCTGNVSGMITLVPPAAPVISTVTPTNPTVCNGNDGSILLSGLQASTGYQLNYWKNSIIQPTVTITTNGSGGYLLSGLTAGTYSNITVTLAGCSSAATGPVTLTDPAAPAVSNVTTSNPTSCTGNNGSITLSGLIPNTTYTVQYTQNTVVQPPSSFTANASGSITINNLTAGNYTSLTLTLNGCTSTPLAAITLTDPATPAITNTSFTNPTTCGGNDGTITLYGLVASATYQVSYSFNTLAQTPVNITANVSGQIILAALSAGNYSNIVVTITNCHSAPAAAITLTNPPAPVITSATFTNITTCNGNDGSIKLTGLIPGAGYTVNYSKNSIVQPSSVINANAAGEVMISGLTAGIYTAITVSYLNCVSNTVGPITLADPPIPVISSTSFFNPTTCSGNNGSITINGLTTGTTYTINYTKNTTPQAPLTLTANAGGSITMTGLTAGIYGGVTVTVNNCTSLPAVNISLSDPVAPVLTIISSTSPTTCAGNNGQIILGGVAANTSYTINYSKNNTVQPPVTATSSGSGQLSLSNLSAGNYTNITVTINNCVSNIAGPALLTDPASPSIATITGNNPTTCTGSNGNIVLGGLTPATTYTVSYSMNTIVQPTLTLTANGSGDITINNLSAGQYSAITVSYNGCNSNTMGPITLTDPVVAVISITASSGPSTCSGNNGTITLHGFNANTGYSIQYSFNTIAQPPLNLTSNASGVILLNNLSAGSYSNITASINGCVSNVAGLVNLTDPTPPSISSSNTIQPSTCGGANGSIILNGLTPNTIYTVIYSYNTAPQGPFTYTSNGSGAITIPSLLAGSYTNIFVSRNNCSSNIIASAILSDPVPPAPTILSATNPSVCGGTDGSISLQNLIPGTIYVLQYSLNSIAQPSQTLVADGTGHITFSNLASGLYTAITVAVNNCISNVIGPVTLINPTATPITASYNAPLCEGDTLKPGVTAIAGAQYNWTGPNSFSSNAMQPFIHPVTLAYNGIYTVTATLNGCVSTATVSVNITPKPAIPIIGSNSPVCEGSILQLNSNTISSANYNWSGPLNFISSSQNPGLNPASTPMSGVYKLLVTVNGCQSDTATTNVIIHPLPAAPGVTTPVLYCEGTPAIPLSATGQNLLWYLVPAGGIGTTTAPTPSTAVAGDHHYYVSQTVNGCESPRSDIVVTIQEKIPANIAMWRTTMCQYDTVSIYNAGNFSPTAQYIWDFDGGTILNGTGAGPYLVQWSGSGFKKIQLIIKNGACITMDTQTVLIRFAPDASFSIPDHACASDSVSIQAAWGSETEKSYYWNFDGGNIISGNGYGPYRLQWLNAGNKTVTLRIEKDGCLSLPATHTIHIQPVPDAKINYVSTTDICSGDTVLFRAFANADYQLRWLPERYFEGMSSTEVFAPVQVTGFIVLEAKDEYGCTSMDSTFINTHPCCDISLPSAFTPNNDGRNDLFRVITVGHHQVSTFRIVNRWGQTVFESPDETRGWDGNFGGAPQDMGTYFYLIKYKCMDGNVYEKKGEVTLLR